jgi:NADH-quinone oxidoreductase subunit N
VYEGAPTPVTAFFSVGPKAAGFAMLVRFLHSVFPEGQPGASPFEWKLVLALLAVLTMAVGNLAALQQQNLKRLLAYSSIAHAGYLLIAFVVFTPASISAILFYVVAYVLMNLGAFLVVLVLEEKYGIETVDGCRGLGWRAPGLCGMMTIFLFSLTGIPPTAGFVGKVLLFSYVIRDSLAPEKSLGIALVVVAVVFSVVSLFYYVRIVAAMFLAKPREAESEPRGGAVYAALLWLLALGTLWFGIFWGDLQGETLRAAQSILAKM